MQRTHWIGFGVTACILLAGCAPSLVVSNTTQFPVRVVIASGGTSQVVSPSPGESSGAEVSEGPFRATVIPDEEWIAYARDTRAFLNKQLADSENLSGPQLLTVVQRLKDIALRMRQYEQAAGTTASCEGNITQDGGGAVEVRTGEAGVLVIAC